LRLLSIPALVIGVAFAILFFKVYGLVTRPSVPLPVAAVVQQFAPNVEIGAKVADVKRGIAAMTYVPHLGFVGVPDSRSPNLPDGYTINFSQVRLLLDERARQLPHPDPAKVRVDAVEIVTGNQGVASEIATALTMTFRRNPRLWCLKASDEAQPRQVQLWMTPNERGGIALISDFFVGAPPKLTAPSITSVIAFVGKFEGSRTLRGNYTDALCTFAQSS
jgi:hypothetical protein